MNTKLNVVPMSKTYYVIIGFDLNQFELKVSQALNNGFELVGGLCVTSHGASLMYAQAVTGETK